MARRIPLLNIALIFLPASAPALAEPTSWMFSRYHEICTKERTYPDGSQVSFDWNVGEMEGSMYAWNKQWTSIIPNKKYDMKLKFDNGPLHPMYALGIKASRKQNGVHFPRLPAAFLTDASRSKSMTIYRDGVLVGRFDLSGSDSAIKQVKLCANPKHPKPNPF